jgi:MoxR-like ATPase
MALPAPSASFSTAREAAERLALSGYLASQETAMAAFLGDRLGKPILVEGPAGVGKTELARALASALGREFIRLQCYEGLDEAKALYEWEYGKQLLYTQLLREKIGEMVQGAESLAQAAEKISAHDAVFFSERFLLPRPLLRALLSDKAAVLLVDEVDKADPEFEAFLLEVLSDYAVTIPELGTLSARHVPRVVLTSNASRELSEALRRRCLHLHMGYPTKERELAILRARLPGVSEKLAAQVVEAVHNLRALELKKAPSISETLDWASGLALLAAERLTPDLFDSTLNLALKHEGDVEKARARLSDVLPDDL